MTTAINTTKLPAQPGPSHLANAAPTADAGGSEPNVADTAPATTQRPPASSQAVEGNSLIGQSPSGSGSGSAPPPASSPPAPQQSSPPSSRVTQQSKPEQAPAQEQQPSDERAIAQQPPVDKPSGEQKPTVAQKPPAMDKPPAQHQPPTPSKPPLNQPPPATHKPPAEPKAPVAQKPPAPAAPYSPPVTERAPITQRPPMEQRPPVTERVPLTHRPWVAQRPFVEQRPFVAKRPSVAQGPSVAQRPSIAEQPMVAQRPRSVKQAPPGKRTRRVRPASGGGGTTSVTLSNRDRNHSVKLTSKRGTSVEIFGDPHVRATVNGVRRAFDIGYGRGSITLKDGTRITWDTYGNRSRALRTFEIDAPGRGRDNKVSTADGKDVRKQKTSLTDAQLREFIAKLSEYRGDWRKPLKRKPGTAIDTSPASKGKARSKHVVKRGDTLWAIARAAGLTVEQVAAFNKIKDPNLIRPGQAIRLPG